MRIALIAVLIIVGAPMLLFVVWIGSAIYADRHPETGENLNSVEWLPQEATDVSHYSSYSFDAYEFTISEEGFLKWAEQSWQVKTITKPVSILRYTFRTTKPPQGPDPEEERYKAYEKLTQAHATSGYYYEYRQDNGGGVVIIFDREKRRAYYQQSPR